MAATLRGSTASASNGKRLTLADCQKGGSGLPPRIVDYGRPAVGKSITFAYTDSPIYLMSPGETGLHTLMDSGQLPANIPNIEVPDWQTLMGLIDELRTGEHHRCTVVIDTINGMEKLANTYTRERDFPGEGGEKKFMEYHAGYQATAMGPWKELLVSLDKLRAERRMMVVLLAHTGIAKVANPSGSDYAKWAPAFDGRWAWNATYAWCDVCLFHDFDVTVSKDKPKDAKGKATSEGERLFRTAWSPDYDAKSRYTMPDVIKAKDTPAETWAEIAQYLKTPAQKESE